MSYRWDIAILNDTVPQMGDTVYATPPRLFSGLKARQVVMAIWDSRGVTRYPDNTRNVAQAAVETLVGILKQKPPATDDEQILVNAVEQSINQARYDSSYWQGALKNGAPVIQMSETDRSYDLTAIAGVVSEQTLYVTHTGNNRAYVLRDHQLIRITEAAPKRGCAHLRFQLQLGDRVLLCTEGLCQQLYETQIAHILINERHPRRAVSTLLDTASRTSPTGNISTAVLYYDELLPIPARIALLIATLFITVALVAVILATGVLNGGGSSEAAGASPVQPTSTTPVVVASPTLAATPTVEVAVTSTQTTLKAITTPNKVYLPIVVNVISE